MKLGDFETLKLRSFGTWELGNLGTLELWTLELWNFGTLEPRNQDTQKPRNQETKGLDVWRCLRRFAPAEKRPFFRRSRISKLENHESEKDARRNMIAINLNNSSPISVNNSNLKRHDLQNLWFSVAYLWVAHKDLWIIHR